MIRYEINQERVPKVLRLEDIWLRRLLRTIERHLRLRGTHMLSVAFVDHATMRRLNRTYRNKNRVTDILSFQLPRSLHGRGQREGDKSLGELILAWPFVRDQAKKNKKTLQEELALLLIHGVLHLRGYDHETKKDAAKMLPFQDRILRNFLKV